MLLYSYNNRKIYKSKRGFNYMEDRYLVSVYGVISPWDRCAYLRMALKVENFLKERGKVVHGQPLEVVDERITQIIPYTDRRITVLSARGSRKWTPEELWLGKSRIRLCLTEDKRNLFQPSKIMVYALKEGVTAVQKTQACFNQNGAYEELLSVMLGSMTQPVEQVAKELASLDDHLEIC